MNILNSTLEYMQNSGFVVQFLVFMAVIFIVKQFKIKKEPEKNTQNTKQQRREMDSYLSKNKISNQPPVNLINKSGKSDNSLILFGAHALLSINDGNASYDGKNSDAESNDQLSASITDSGISERVSYSSNQDVIVESSFSACDLSSSNDCND